MTAESAGGSGAVRAVAAALLLVALVPAAAQAAQWYQHYERGLEAAERGEWAAALADFEAAERLEPHPRAQARTYGSRFVFAYDPPFQRARCLAGLGRWREAGDALAAADAAAVTPAPQRASLARRIAEGERAAAPPASSPATPGPPLAGRLAVVSAPPGAAVRVDDLPWGATPRPERPLAAGRHRVRLELRGHEPWEEEIEVRPGEVFRLEVALRAPVPQAAPSVAGARPEREGPGRGREAGEASRAVDPAAAERTGGPPAAAGPARQGPAEGGLGAASGGQLPGAETGAVSAGDRSEAASGPGAAGAIDSAPGEGTAAPAGPAPFSAPPGSSSSQPTLSWTVSAMAATLAATAVVLAILLLRFARRRRFRRSAGQGSGRWPGRDGRLGRYRLDTELGRGGMAVTYRARRLSDGLEVALKVPHTTGDPTFHARFLREGHLGETLHHPRIVRIVEVGEDDGTPFLALELIPGRTLREEIDAHPEGLPLDRALAVAREIAEALDYAHGKGVVHRDLKPDNVMLLPEGGLKVMDFGVARVEGQPGLTTSEFFFGSPLYAAPESVEPRTVGAPADLYSLGVLLFEMLAGRPPFVHESLFKVLELHQRAALPGPESLSRRPPEEVWAVVARLCAKRPEDRYASAQELLVELNRLEFGGAA